MLIYIVKTNDNRYYHLQEFLKQKYECCYSNALPVVNNIKTLVLPLSGIDEFGYIKNTNLKLEKFLLGNQVKEIYTGYVNKLLLKIAEIYKIKVISFYDDIIYLKNDFLVKIDVIKTFVEEKFSVRFSDLKALVIGNDYKAYLLSERLNIDIYDKGSVSNKAIKDFLWSNYDVIINCSKNDLSVCDGKVIIEMDDITDIDIYIFANFKNIYFINQLETQFLTKSGGKILYDSMVNR